MRARGWVLADEELAPRVPSSNCCRSTCRTCCGPAGDVSADWALWQSRPHTEVRQRTAGVAAG